MTSTGYYISIVTLIVFSIAYFALDKFSIKRFNLDSKLTVEYANATKALEMISTWTSWLTGLQTAAMAAMVLLLKDHEVTNNLKLYGFFAILFFGASIMLATWLLSSMPSIQQRLSKTNNPSVKNDIYMMTIFTFVPFRLGRFSGLMHSYFLVGIVFFGLYIFEIVSQGGCSKIGG